SITENHLQSIPMNFCLVIELASQPGLQPKHMKIPRCDGKPVEPHRLTRAGKLQVIACVSSHRFKGLVARTKIEKFERVQRELRVVGIGKKKSNQPVSLGV